MLFKGGNPARSRRGWLGLATFFAFALALSGCTGTEVQDPYEIVAGKVISEDGAAAVGVRVMLVREGFLVLGKSGATATPAGKDSLFPTQFSDITDHKGIFKFDSIPIGSYVLRAIDSVSTKVATDTIKVNKSTKYSFYNLPLKHLGTVVGIVSDVADGKPLQGAICTVESSRLSDTTEAHGIFNFSLPEGMYGIDCWKEGYWSDPRQNLFVVSDSNPTVLIGLTNRVKEERIPVPSAVSISKDPVTGEVRVAWTRPASLEHFRYSIRRIDIDNPTVIKLFEVGESDTDFYDIPFGGAPVSLFRKGLSYAVACVKRDGKKSEYTKSLPNVETVTRGAELNLRFADAVMAFAVGDTARLIGEFSGGIFPASRFNWTLGDAQDSLRLVDSLRVLPGSDLAAGRDTLVYPCTALGSVGIRLTIRDKSGGISFKLKTLVIIAPPP